MVLRFLKGNFYIRKIYQFNISTHVLNLINNFNNCLFYFILKDDNFC